MRINRSDILFEQPILRVRDVIRDAMMERLKSRSKVYIETRVAMLLVLLLLTLQRVLALLILQTRMGYEQ